LINYDKHIGFRFTEEGGTYRTSTSQQSEKQRDSYTYQLESYTDHIQKMLRLYQKKYASRIAYVSARLEHKAGFTVGSIDRAIRLAIALHDLGKLDKLWQAWIRAYQTEIGEPIDDTFMAVHTHMDTPEHKAISQNIKHPRPPHAGEGAIAGAKIAHQILSNNHGLRKAVVSAIARHHSAQTDKFGEYQLHNEAETTLKAALKAVNLEINAARNLLPKAPATDLKKQILQPDDSILEWITYFLIVRTLRLVDGGSQEEQKCIKISTS